MPTLIKGKDAPLEDTLGRFQHALSGLGLKVIESNLLNPLTNVFSVHLEIEGCPEICANGKGALRESALVSAYGELIERIATHASFSDYFLGLDNARAPYVHFRDEKWTALNPDDPHVPNDLLNASLRKYYCEGTGLTLDHLIDLQTSSYERGVCSLPFTNARNGEIVYFPVNLLDNLYGSNGMSAGNTDYEALVQALAEVIERYVKREIIKKGLSLPRIPPEVIARCPKSEATLHELQGGGLTVACFDASLGGKFPVVCVVLFNERNGTCCASFGAHPMFEVALERTLTELMQGRTFSDLDNFEEPTFDLARTSDITNLESHFIDSTGLLPIQMFRKVPDYRFVSWDFTGGTHDQYKALRYMVDRLGFDVYVRAYPELGVPVYRVIVPGMSEIYPVDDLLYNNTNGFIDFQEALLSLPGTSEMPQTYRTYLDELEQDQGGNEVGVSNALGLLPDQNSPWGLLRLGELKCLLALAAKDFSAALEYARWTVDFNRYDFPLKRLRFYLCLVKALECKNDGSLNEDEYQGALALIYGQDTLDHVNAHLNGTERFNDLKSSDLSLAGFIHHQELIRIYNLVKEAKP